MISVQWRQISTLLIAVFVATACAHARPQPEVVREKAAPPDARILFATASSRVAAKERNAINANIAWLKITPNAAVILEGHADERGSEEYNMALGDRRARSVAAELLRGGVNPWQVVGVISRGELSPIARGHNLRTWAANRRVEIIVR